MTEALVSEAQSSWTRSAGWSLRRRLGFVREYMSGDVERGDGGPDFKRRRQDFQSDSVMDLMMASRRSRLKVALEDSTWQRRRIRCIGEVDTPYRGLGEYSISIEHQYRVLEVLGSICRIEKTRYGV
ncbi:hypothetical protein Tco_0806031 [Tanacetum coccineum]